MPAAAATVEGRFETSFVEHAYIEPEAGFAVPRRRADGGLRLHAGALHGPRRDRPRARRRAVASAHPADRLRRRLRRQARRLDPAAARGRRARHRRAGAHRLQPHRIDGLDHQAASRKDLGEGLRRCATAGSPPSRCRRISTPAPMPPGARRWRTACRCTRPGPTSVPNAWNRTRAIYTNDTPAGAFRGFGVPQAAIANETLMDDLAEAARPRPLANPPHQCARPRRHDAVGAGAARTPPACRNASMR